VFCQLEILRDCFPSSVRRTLDELPESLDETYERVLKEIKKPNRDHARRLLCCLVAAVRPLRVEELAEVIAVDFDNAEGIPRLNPNWRWEDEEQALLTSCSSLIVIVKSGASRVVQFSHFSVKEFLTSNRLATSSEDVLHYHIALEPAHMTLAQTCMSALLRSDNRVKQNGVKNNSPLAGYAVRHWISHAKYGNVSSCLRKAMDYLFDPDKPYFAAWLQLHDVDTRPSSGSTFFLFSPTPKSDAGPLYYAALCGLQDLVEHLILKYPQQVNASGGYYVTPMVAALAGEHFRTAKILWDNGAHHNVRGRSKTTPLHSAAHHGPLRIIQVLLEFEADVNARNEYGETPLHYVMERVCLNPNLSQMDGIARFFLEHGAEVDALSNDHTTPLHIATRGGRVEVVRVLLEHGADINTRSNDNSTSLHIAVRWGSIEVVPVLLERGADVNARSDDHSTSLHIAAQKGRAEVVRVLLEHDADVNARSDDHSTPLHVAARWGRLGVVSVLLEHGVDVGAGDVRGRTPFQVASLKGHSDITKLLSEHGAK
jgi:ankyrin repeat protein